MRAFCILERGRALFRQGADQHDHLAALHLREVLDLAVLFYICGYPLEQFAAKVLVCHLTPAKAQGDFHFVAIAQELIDVAHLDLIVAAVRIGAEFDFFDLDDLLFLAGLGLTLLRLVFELAEIHDLAHRRICVWRNFYKVEPCLIGHHHGAGRGHNPFVFAICANQADFGRADVFVYALAGVTLRRCVMGSASDDGRP